MPSPASAASARPGFRAGAASCCETIPVGPHETGRVRVEREEWRAESVDGSEIAVGATVHVLRVDGTRLIVVEPGRSPTRRRAP